MEMATSKARRKMIRVLMLGLFMILLSQARAFCGVEADPRSNAKKGGETSITSEPEIKPKSDYRKISSEPSIRPAAFPGGQWKGGGDNKGKAFPGGQWKGAEKSKIKAAKQGTASHRSGSGKRGGK